MLSLIHSTPQIFFCFSFHGQREDSVLPFFLCLLLIACCLCVEFTNERQFHRTGGHANVTKRLSVR